MADKADRKEKKEPKERLNPISLHPLSLEDALEAFMKFDPKAVNELPSEGKESSDFESEDSKS